MRSAGRIAGLLVAMGLVGSAFVVVIGTGFRISGDPMPEFFDLALLPALLVVLFLAALVITLVALRIWPAGRPAEDFRGVDRHHWQRVAEAQAAVARKRLAALDANPATRKYADRIRAGHWWSDEAIAYDRDPLARITCVHLKPIEGAMREAGIVLRVYADGRLDATCTIAEARLMQKFGIAAPVYYDAHVPGDRPFEPESAVIVCHEHGSAISVVHPSDGKPNTPRFP